MVKTPRDSQTEMIQIVHGENINGRYMLFGGQLACWIDITATVAARRHAECMVTTACIDNIRYLKPIPMGTFLVLKAKVTYAGKSSMEIKVDTYAEAANGELDHVSVAYVVFVAIDDNGKTRQVPQLMPETEEEKIEHEKAVRRNQLRKMRLSEDY